MQGDVGDQITIVNSTGVPKDLILVAGSGGAVDASAVTYTPGNAAVWPIPPPTSVAAALDLLGALHGQILSNPLRAPTSGELQVVGLGPFNVTPAKSGVYLAWASVEFQCPINVTAGQADLTLLVDSVAQGQPLGSGFTNGLWATTFSQVALVTVNRTLTHAWELFLNTNAATAIGHVEAAHGKLLLLEL
jgi:hypothetical protein